MSSSNPIDICLYVGWVRVWCTRRKPQTCHKSPTNCIGWMIYILI